MIPQDIQNRLLGDDGYFKDGVLHSKNNGWQMQQCFGSTKTIFALLPHRISKFNYATFRAEHTGKIAWLRRIDKQTDDMDARPTYYTEI